MNNRRYKINLKTIVLISLLVFSIFFMAQISLFQKARDNWLFFRSVTSKISDKYVEMVDMGQLMNVAIKSVVGHLDPYTEYIEDNAQDRMMMITEGTYGGLGMEIGIREDQVTVIAPIEDTPAKRAGIRAGDIIFKIDNQLIKDLSLDKVSLLLRGDVDTRIKLELKRPGLDENIIIELIRAKIIIKDVPYYSFLEPGLAYVKLNGFTEKAPAEFINAINDLQRQDKIKTFVLDLRSNPGGLLNSAVKISNVFLEKGKPIVSTKGAHEPEKKYVSYEKPLLGDIPVVVLVDNGSASASEIVTGALQDLDRGIVVGDTTYGKGLVQKIFQIDDMGEVQLKMTTAKYFTPSGRCIQREDYKLKEKDIFRVEAGDSLFDQKLYQTVNGRQVYSGGGIAPDITIPNQKLSSVIQFLWREGAVFNFVVEYLSKNNELRERGRFDINDHILAEFREYLKLKNLNYISSEQKSLNLLIEKVKIRTDLVDSHSTLLEELRKFKKADAMIFNQVESDIKWALKLEFAAQIENNDMRLKILNERDEQLKKAIEILKDQQSYNQMLVRN